MCLEFVNVRELGHFYEAKLCKLTDTNLWSKVWSKSTSLECKLLALAYRCDHAPSNTCSMSTCPNRQWTTDGHVCDRSASQIVCKWNYCGVHKSNSMNHEIFPPFPTPLECGGSPEGGCIFGEGFFHASYHWTVYVLQNSSTYNLFELHLVTL